MEAKGEAKGQMDRLRQLLQKGMEIEETGADAEVMAVKVPQAKDAKAKGAVLCGGYWIFFIFICLILFLFI
jgi:hypothetical protein